MPAAEAFDEEGAWRLSGSVSLRPEPFGALLYDFVTRRLSFLKTKRLVAVVEGLAGAADVGAALDAAGVTGAERPAYLGALAGLARSGLLVPKQAA